MDDGTICRKPVATFAILATAFSHLRIHCGLNQTASNPMKLWNYVIIEDKRLCWSKEAKTHRFTQINVQWTAFRQWIWLLWQTFKVISRATELHFPRFVLILTFPFCHYIWLCSHWMKDVLINQRLLGNIKCWMYNLIIFCLSHFFFFCLVELFFCASAKWRHLKLFRINHAVKPELNIDLVALSCAVCLNLTR